MSRERKTMKVLHINGNYILSNLHQLMTRNLAAAGIENKVYVPARRGVQRNVTPDEGVVVSECFNLRDRYVFYYKQAKIRRDIERKIDCGGFDCYHAYTLFTDGNVAYGLSRKYHIPYVVAVRDTDVNVFFRKRPYLRNRGIQILRGAKAVFFLSQTYRRQVMDRYVPEKFREELEAKSHVIPNGIDAFWLNSRFGERDGEAIRQRITQEHKLNVCFVGVISRRKNASTTVRALKMLQQDGWEIRYNVIGPKEDEEEYKAVMGFEGTNYLGKKPKEEIIGTFRESDIFIMPSVTETFGLTYAEAMTQGLPVIYSRGQGFDGQFEEGTVGYAVDCFSAEEIVEKIKKTVDHYQEISSRCVSCSAVFNWGTIVEKYKDIYQEITAGMKERG